MTNMPTVDNLKSTHHRYHLLGSTTFLKYYINKLGQPSESGARNAVGPWEPGARTEKQRCGGRILLPVASRAHRWWRRSWPGPGSRGKMEIRWAVPVRWQKDAAHLLGWVCALWVAPFSGVRRTIFWPPHSLRRSRDSGSVPSGADLSPNTP